MTHELDDVLKALKFLNKTSFLDDEIQTLTAYIERTKPPVSLENKEDV